MFEFKTIFNGQRVGIELEKPLSGTSELVIVVGDLVISNTLRDVDGVAFNQTLSFVNKLLNADLKRYRPALEYLYSFLEAYDKLNSDYKNY